MATEEEEKRLEADLAKAASRVCNHMNKDHMASIKAYSLAFGEHERCNETESAKLTGLNRNGFQLQVTLQDGTVLDDVLVPYQGKVSSSSDLHMEAISMHKKAFNQLGVWYKARNGYYKTAAKMIGFGIYKKVKGKPVIVIGVIGCAVAGVGAYYYTKNKGNVQQSLRSQ